MGCSAPSRSPGVARSVNPLALPAPSLPLKLLAPAVSGLGFATLPRWARRLFGIPASPLTDVAVTASLRALHEAIAHGPGDRLVLPSTRAARDRARAVQRAHSPQAASRRQPAAVRGGPEMAGQFKA